MIYCVIRMRRLEELESMVNHRLKNGWVLQGGIAVDKDDYMLQALAKEETLEDEYQDDGLL